MSFNPDGQRLPSGVVDGSDCTIWSVLSGQKLIRYTGHDNKVLTTAFALPLAANGTPRFGALTAIQDPAAFRRAVTRHVDWSLTDAKGGSSGFDNAIHERLPARGGGVTEVDTQPLPVEVN